MDNFKNLYEQSDRMIQLINYNSGDYVENDYFIIYEGLIKTIKLDKSMNLLGRWFLMYNMSDRDNITIDNKSDTITINLLPFQKDINKVKELLKYINNLGYFISIVYYKYQKDREWNDFKYDEKKLFDLIKQYDNLERLYIILEAKFDIERDIPDKLYHVTRQDVLEKIKKIGLSPRSGNKKGTHPERIYFAKTYDDTYDIYGNFKAKNKEQKYVILEIDTSLVKHIRVFDDPNYKGYGYYILVNVHPNAITILKENL